MTIRKIAGVKYDVSAFHPTAYEEGVYVVRAHDHGKPFLDRYSKSTFVHLEGKGSPRQALDKGLINLFPPRKRGLDFYTGERSKGVLD